MRNLSIPLTLGAALALSACGSSGEALPPQATYGENPALPAPRTGGLPTINPAKGVGWPQGRKPAAAEGFSVNAFASGLDHPRWMLVLPGGDVLVAESNSPPREVKGIVDWVAKMMMKRAGAGEPSANRISLLRDADGDGVAENRTAFLTGLNSPFGMALVGDALYVANTDAVLRFTYVEGATEIAGPGEKVMDLPAGPPNNHWTRNVAVSPDGTKLYVTVGSNSNIAEHGMDKEEGRAAIHVLDLETGESRIFASGLRNPNGLAFEPVGGELWTTVNERDMLGDDLVADYMTSVRDGGFYGWPYSYWGGHVDARVEPQRPDLVAQALEPDYALGAHTASLGLAFYQGEDFPERYRSGAFVGQHGSWNRSPRSGYKVVFVPFANGRPAGPAEDFLTGFLNEDDEAMGRPVGVIQAGDGALLVADDVGNVIWRVAPKP